MLVKNLDIQEIRAGTLDHQHKKITLHITFTNDTPLTRDIIIQKNNQQLAEDLLKWIKHQKHPAEDTNDDVLSGVIITNIAGDPEELSEKIAHGLTRVYQKFDNVSTIRTAREYIQTFHQLKTAQEIVYQKKA